MSARGGGGGQGEKDTCGHGVRGVKQGWTSTFGKKSSTELFGGENIL